MKKAQKINKLAVIANRIDHLSGRLSEIANILADLANEVVAEIPRKKRSNVGLPIPKKIRP